ncbi:MBOAT family protein [Rhodoblastus acidophilus]|uniref:Probable alginate O-acetylase AlgI n=1 Tax=Candidatus Rhodoblastus alkanivorans TaxID=2954117 RepID=A0ABS9Z2Q8_9HYPH|nr:MBOAT family O-acyltransferase [Candidatus Rhodoblastus alkanivorans]MCI4680448.1 MBOAT family protein [Candidatus Rhodoblastus alkanivorans]MCI4681941.1 MBOAT family protein [Candidatus Rhodoblastus alkanivorans]MDI4642991.1 MBOAT family protein [Rhodoblastus acidophilus]
MLFNSFAFVLGFLPIAFAGYFLASRLNGRFGVAFLALASLAFYSYWDWRLTFLLCASILVNYTIGAAIARSHEKSPHRAKVFLISGLALNLGCLIYFKYMNWLIDTINRVSTAELSFIKVVLPLGISFYTFTQIAFLVDSFKCKVKERNIGNYFLFVTYFPHLIAGPVLHHAEMMPQFADPSNKRPVPANIAFGLALFLMGVVKKVVFADSVAPFADHVFNGHGPLGAAAAWSGALAYTAQIYFDFSGYTDMALGLSRMFNIKLPLNFDSPYKARSIVDFWRRWHMTLSRFLRDYLYIPLGGNRLGFLRRYLNLFITMLLGGLWHGAGWTFLIWGALHGLYLVVNHAVTGLREKFGIAWRAWMAPFGWGLTFLAVVVGWVFFRASSLEGAIRVLEGMVAFNAPPPHAVAPEYPHALIGRLEESPWPWIAGLLALAFLSPNSQQVIAWAETRLKAFGRAPRPSVRDFGRLFAPFAFTGFAATIVLFVISLTGIRHGASPFIYFNF